MKDEYSDALSSLNFSVHIKVVTKHSKFTLLYKFTDIHKLNIHIFNCKSKLHWNLQMIGINL